MPFGISTNICEPTEFTPTEISLNTELPERVINDEHIWWPVIINQGTYNSCVQCAEIAYTFTYEINRKRNLDAGDFEDEYPDRRYSQHYTYNQEVKGDDGGSDWHSGFCMIRDNGCPTYADFKDLDVFGNPGPDTYTYWMTGDSKYINGMTNRISEIYQFTFGPSTEDLNFLKHWIADHGSGESSGGLAIIGVAFHNHYTTKINQPGIYNNESILTLGDSSQKHALTIVGYDDDFPVSATEFGAFRVANSWGSEGPLAWGTAGFAWLPYSDLVSTNNTSLELKYAYTCDVEPTAENPINNPAIAISANIEHNHRNELTYYVGPGEISSTLPQSNMLFQTFSEQGNDESMRGTFYEGEPIDLAFNFSHFYQDDWINPFQRIFFNLNGIEGCQTGNINTVKLIDHRWNEVFEIPFHEIDNSIGEGDNWSYIDYYLLTRPEHNFITGVTNLNTNRISRFYTEVRA